MLVRIKQNIYVKNLGPDKKLRVILILAFLLKDLSPPCIVYVEQ